MEEEEEEKCTCGRSGERRRAVGLEFVHDGFVVDGHCGGFEVWTVTFQCVEGKFRDLPALLHLQCDQVRGISARVMKIMIDQKEKKRKEKKRKEKKRKEKKRKEKKRDTLSQHHNRLIRDLVVTRYIQFGQCGNVLREHCHRCVVYLGTPRQRQRV